MAIDPDELLRQNEALNQQVKLLVRTEKRLYQAQRTIEKQLDRIHVLNDFALAVARESEEQPIVERLLDLLFGVLRLDEAVAFLAGDGGELVLVAERRFERPPGPAGTLSVPTVALRRPEVLGAGAPPDELAPLLARVAAYLEEDRPRKASVVLPFCREGDQLLGLVVLRTIETLHFDDQLPGPADVPFLELARLHLESALAGVRERRETARKASLDKELEVARTVQQALVPPADVVELGRLALAGCFQPASVCGGDFWTWRRLDDERVAVVIGDVTGHGVPAALITAVALGAIESLPADISPVRALTLLDQAVHRASKGKLLMSCFVTIVDLSSGRATYASAGHPAPFVVNAGSGKLGCWMARGPLLGGTLSPSLCGEHVGTLEPGDVILWFTDGLSECTGPGGELWGERRLRQALRQAAKTDHAGGIRAGLEQAVAGFAGSSERGDDLTFVVGRFT